MTQQTTHAPSATDVLMGGGGGGAPTAKFDEPGTTYGGRITQAPRVHQVRDYDRNNPGGGAPKFYPSGDPIMGLTVIIQTDQRDPSIEGDDGSRCVYIEGRYIKEDVREAVRAAGAPGLEVGGELHLTFTHREDPMDKRSRKFWKARYVPAGQVASGDVLGVQEQQQAPAPQPAASAQQDVLEGLSKADHSTAQTLIRSNLPDETILAAVPSLTPVQLAALKG